MKKSRAKISQRIGFSCAALLATGATAAQAQTSGSLSTTVSVNYSAAPWNLTAGSGTYPDGGGVATFNEQVGTTPGTLPLVPTITLDVSPTLSGLTFNDVYQYTLAAGTGFALNLTTTGTNTLSVLTSSFSSPTLFAVGSVITAPIGGGGTFGLTKTGAGVITLAGTNTYTGGTFITGGTLRITTGDAALGTTGTGNDVTLDGGTLRSSTTALTTARNFTLGSGGGTLELIAASTINGVVSGAGSLTARLGGALTLTGANTYTGATTVQSSGSLTLSGTGTLATTSGLDLTGTLALTDATTNVNNRLGSVPITTRGATITLAGNASAPSAQSTGTITLNSGNTAITVTPAAGGVDALTLAGVTRSNNSVLFVRGTSLGAAAAASVAQIYASTAPTLVGGGGAAGTSTLSIVPWMVGNTSATSTFSSSLVTYGATGFRPLTTSEYGTSLATSTATTNVRLTAATAVPAGGATVNALVLAFNGTTALSSTSGSVLNITSGELLYSYTSSSAATISANLNFGTAEGIVHNANTAALLTLSGTIAGSGGLTLNALGTTTPSTSGNFAITGTANTYTGTTTLDSGTTTFTGTITNDGVTPSALGEGTTAIVMNAGVQGVRLYANATGAVINRDLLVTGTASTIPTTSLVGLGTVGTSYGLTMNGNITLNRPLALEGNGTLATGIILNGVVSGAGYLTDSFGSYNVLYGNNTFTGGINVLTGTYVAGSDTAFGTGTIYSTANAGSVQGIIPTGSTQTVRTLANPFLFENGTSAVFNFGGATPLNLTGTMNLNGNTALGFTNTGGTTFSGVVANGSLTKSGSQALTLASKTGNTYTGGTVVSAGSVLVTNTSGSATGTGAVSVTGTGTVLGGTGFIVGPATTVASGSILQGGAGVPSGALTLNTNLTLSSGSIVQLALGDGGVHSTLSRAGGTWVFATNQAFNFTYGGPVGFYDNLITGLASDPGGESTWTINNAGFVGTFAYDNTGNIDLTLTASPVPEPTTVLGGVFTVGLLGMGLRRRVRRMASR